VECRVRVLSDLRVLLLVRDRVLEHDRVEVRVRERELAVPQAALPQPVHHVGFRARLDRLAQPVESLDQQRADQAVLAAEPVVDAHRGDPGLGGDGAYRHSARSVPDQHRLGRRAQRLLDISARRPAAPHRFTHARHHVTSAVQLALPT